MQKRFARAINGFKNMFIIINEIYCRLKYVGKSAPYIIPALMAQA